MKNNSPFNITAKQLFTLCGTALTRFKGLSAKAMGTFIDCGMKAATVVEDVMVAPFGLACAVAEGKNNALNAMEGAYSYGAPIRVHNQRSFIKRALNVFKK